MAVREWCPSSSHKSDEEVFVLSAQSQHSTAQYSTVNDSKTSMTTIILTITSSHRIFLAHFSSQLFVVTQLILKKFSLGFEWLDINSDQRLQPMKYRFYSFDFHMISYKNVKMKYAIKSVWPLHSLINLYLLYLSPYVGNVTLGYKDTLINWQFDF